MGDSDNNNNKINNNDNSEKVNNNVETKETIIIIDNKVEVPSSSSSSSSDDDSYIDQSTWSYKLKLLIKEYKVLDLFKTATGWMFIWLGFAVVASGAALTLVMLFKIGSNRDYVTEVNSQILNTIFTLLAISSHPLRLYDIYLLCRGSSHQYKLSERYPWYFSRENQFWHIAVILVLLNLNCFAQYFMAFAMWTYHYDDRPAVIVAVSLPVSFAAGTIGGILQMPFFVDKFWKGKRVEQP